MRGFYFLAILITVTLIDLFVPYIAIGHIASLWASYLFWSLLTLVVIGFVIIYTSRWGRRS
ncbi:MAG: hypothetical protein K9J79_08740 [Desulfobacteraceae bacterium]|nr:hypothetical protein [Desulfobacteraceae bacterium]